MLKQLVAGNDNNMKDFLTDEEMAQLESGSTPDFISDEQMSQYETPTLSTQPEKELGFMEKAGQFATGVAKGELTTGRNILGAGEWALGKITGKPTEVFRGPTPESLKPVGPYETAGHFSERVAEFLAPSRAITKVAGKAAEVVSKATPILKGTAGGATKIGIQGVAGGTQALAQTGDVEQAKTTAIVSTLLPVAGAGAQKLAGKIILSNVRPGLDVAKDIKASPQEATKKFTDDIFKYKLTGSLNQMAEKSANFLNERSKKLETLLANSKETVDLNAVVKNVVTKLYGKKSMFGDIAETDSALVHLGNEIKRFNLEVAGNPNAVISLLDATAAKRGAGLKGAWMYGSSEKGASAMERVYTTFYQELRKAIDSKGGSQVSKLNKEMSDVIPILNSVVRRIPVADRNNALGLEDTIGLYGAAFDPRALGILGVKVLSKSNRFASFLDRVANSYAGSAGTKALTTSPTDSQQTISEQFPSEGLNTY